MSEPSLKRIALVKNDVERYLMHLTHEQEKCLLSVLFYERCVNVSKKNGE